MLVRAVGAVGIVWPYVLQVEGEEVPDDYNENTQSQTGTQSETQTQTQSQTQTQTQTQTQQTPTSQQTEQQMKMGTVEPTHTSVPPNKQ